MMLVMLFLTWHLWRMSKRIKETELTDKAQWRSIGMVCEDIIANRKRIEALEKDGDHHD